MGEQKVTGIVIHEMAIGEADKRIVIFTSEIGKIQAFAKGARKQKSKFLASTQLFCVSDFLIYTGKNSNVITQVELIHSFHSIREDLMRMSYGMYFLEMLNFLAREEEVDQELYHLMIRTLQVMVQDKISLSLIARIFEIKAMVYSGYKPFLHHCISCGSTKEPFYFSTTMGGVLCLDCREKDHNAVEISKGTVYTLQFICDAPLSKLFSFHVSERVLEELEKVTLPFIQFHLEYTFKTREFIRQLS